MIKNVSKADVAFINKELNDKDTNRMNYLLENLDKDESHDVFAYIYEILQKNMFS